MKLYFAPGTCSLAPIILAEWLDLPLELEKVNHREPSPEWLAINPLGAVPAMERQSGCSAWAARCRIPENSSPAISA